MYPKSARMSNFFTLCSELLLALRSHSLRVIKANFSSNHKKDLSCPLLCDPSNPQDEQSHLLCCKKILEQLNTNELQAIKISDYSHLYGSLDEQLLVTHIFRRLLQVIEQLLDETSPSPAGGTSLVTAPPDIQRGSGN